MNKNTKRRRTGERETPENVTQMWDCRLRHCKVNIDKTATTYKSLTWVACIHMCGRRVTFQVKWSDGALVET